MAMAYTTETLAYEVINDMAPKELLGSVWILGQRYILPRGINWELVFSLAAVNWRCSICR